MSFVYSFAQILCGFCREKSIPVLFIKPWYQPRDFSRNHLAFLLRQPKDAEIILGWLQDFSDLTVTRPDRMTDRLVMQVSDQQGQFLTLELVTELSWLNIPYLGLAEVFERSVTFKETPYPDPKDQAFILLMEGTGNDHPLFMKKIFENGIGFLEEKLVACFGYQATLHIEERLKAGDFSKPPLGPYLLNGWYRHGIGILNGFIRWSWVKIGIFLLSAKQKSARIGHASSKSP